MGNLHGTAEIDDGHQPVRTSVIVDKPGRRLTGSNLVAGIHGGIVEEQDQVALLRAGRGGRIGLEGKTLDGLFLVVFPDTKILQDQIMNVRAFLVGYHGVHQDQPRFRADDSLRRGRSGGLLSPRHSARKKQNSRQTERQPRRRHRLRHHNKSGILRGGAACVAGLAAY